MAWLNELEYDNKKRKKKKKEEAKHKTCHNICID